MTLWKNDKGPVGRIRGIKVGKSNFFTRKPLIILKAERKRDRSLKLASRH